MRWACPLSVLTLFLFITFPSIGQRKITFGVSAGWNNASLSGKINNLPLNFSSQNYTGSISGFSFEKQSGIMGGVHAVIPLGKQSFLQPELLYAQMGSKFTMNMEINETEEGNVFPVPIHGKLHLDYLVLPLLYKYKLEDRPGGWAFYGGVQPAYVVRNGLSIEDNGNNRVDLNSKKFDVQGVAGAEFFLPSGWGATVRYQIGMITRDESIGPLSSRHVRNGALSLLLCYRLH